jgi:hypothetical protein
LLWGQPRGVTVLVLAILLLVVLGLIEFVARAGTAGSQPRESAPPATTSPLS